MNEKSTQWQFNKVVIKVFIGIIVLLLFQFSCAKDSYLTSDSQKIHEKYWNSESLIFDYLMKDTEYETPIFHFKGEKKGKTILIIGGTHGNEPAGFEAGHRLLEKFNSGKVKKGEIFLIPEANKIADIKGNRRIKVPTSVDRELGNLNRCYPGNSHGLPMEKAAFQITELIKKYKIDILIDMHESPVYHTEYKQDAGEYHGLGQTIIYTFDEESTFITMIVVDKMNSDIPEGVEQFSLAAKPVKHSAAWNAGYFFNIPGFTLETCKKLPLEKRITYQMKIVSIILKMNEIID